MTLKKEVVEVYNEYWKDIIEKDGVFSQEQAKRELCDFHNLMDGLPSLYTEITGNRISKLNTKKSDISQEFTKNLNREIDNAIEEYKEMNRHFSGKKDCDGKDICEDDIVECEAFRDIVVIRNGVFTTERNVSNQPLEIHTGLKVIGNIYKNEDIVTEMRKKQWEAKILETK